MQKHKYYAGRRAAHTSARCRYNGQPFVEVDGERKHISTLDPDMTEEEAEDSDLRFCPMCVEGGQMGAKT